MGLFNRKSKLTLGLGLGGGGAKGSVHLGALRAFEEEGLCFDVFAGTSIGSIVGGLCARGYSSREIEALFVGGGVNDIGKLMMAQITGLGMDGLLAKLFGNMSFDELKHPFASVAVDLASGEEAVFTDGDLAKCVAASCSILPYFRAVEIDGRAFVDGAYRNIIPCDAAKNLGADFVVGIDLSNNRQSTEKGKAQLDEAYPHNGVPVCNPSENGYLACDYMIAPDMAGFSATSFSSVSEMFDIGYFAAKESIADIKTAIERKREQLK